MVLKWLFGKNPKQEPKTLEEECLLVTESIKNEEPSISKKLQKDWQSLADCELALDEDSLPTGVEACLWALQFLKMVEEAEGLKIGGEGISQRLESIQSIKDEEGTGCRVRYARGILQDYAASGRGYQTEQKALFVGEWLFNCNKDASKEDDLIGSIGAYRKIGEVLLGDDTQRSWFKIK
jgi:hypothetical protein